MKYRQSIVPFFLSLAIIVVLAGTEAEAATVAQCEDAWDSAPADDDCWDENISVNASGQCVLTATCNSGWVGEPDRSVSTYNSLTTFGALRYCTGTLTPGC